ncbi:MAG TPA: alpha-L-rhamnosidase N-terminal domain-containing protein, partial [bacterium]|nr:alpha-L-rhamnosidase N-terminal domain-containing protein [bacterium]
TKAKIFCAADSKYRFWINGRYAGFGPARGHPEHPYYDTYTVNLNKGENVIAFLVEHYTDPTTIFAPVEGGLICQIITADGLILTTDNSWKAKTADAYSPLPNCLFPECFDANLEPENWETSDFDDTGWNNAVEKINTKLAPVTNLIPRPIPLLTEKLLLPQRILHIYKNVKETNDFLDKEKICETLWSAKQLEINKNALTPEIKPPCKWQNNICLDILPNEGICIMLDFGFETLSAIEICAESVSGIIIDLGYSECLWSNKVATLWQSGAVLQGERIILRHGRTLHRINQPRGFRYLLIRIFNPLKEKCRVILKSVTGYEEIYPAKQMGMFRCPDKVFEDIYNLSARTVNLCMEDSYTDCPWRERSQWIGDSQPEALFNYYCFGIYDMSKKAILEFTQGNTP